MVIDDARLLGGDLFVVYVRLENVYKGVGSVCCVRGSGQRVEKERERLLTANAVVEPKRVNRRSEEERHCRGKERSTRIESQARGQSFLFRAFVLPCYPHM